MTLKPVILPVKLIDAGDMSTSLISDVLNTQYMDNIGLQIVWTTSDAVGTWGVELSIDGATWTPLTLSSVVTVAGTNDNAYLDLNQLSANLLRVVYTSTSGTGTCDVWTTAKII